MENFENSIDLQTKLHKIGLTKHQAIIYIALVNHQELRIQEITRLTNIPRSSVYECLNRLFELGIAEEVIRDNYKLIRPYSVGVMHHGLDEEILRVKRLKQDLNILEKELILDPIQNDKDSSTIRYYKDRSGARQLYWNTLKANNEVYVYSDWGRGRYVGMKYYQNFVEESRKRNIKEKVLINPTKHALESIRQFTYPNSPISRTNLEDIRVIDEKLIKINGDTLIYDNVYATVYLKNVKISGFEIESNHFAIMQRSIFDYLWLKAIPVKDLL